MHNTSYQHRLQQWEPQQHRVRRSDSLESHAHARRHEVRPAEGASNLLEPRNWVARPALICDRGTQRNGVAWTRRSERKSSTYCGLST